MTLDFVELTYIESELEAQFVAHELDVRKVPHSIHRKSAPIFGGLFGGTIAWGSISAPEKCRRVVREIVDAYRDGFNGCKALRSFCS